MKKLILMAIFAGLLASCTKESMDLNTNKFLIVEFESLEFRTGDDDEDESSGKVKGTVTDENGNPQIGLPVDLEKDGANYYELKTTDSNGEFEFDSLSTGLYDLRIEPNTAGEQVFEVDVY